ncbi:MAG: YdcF family protein [Alphaproteobacteria bacterium]
MELAKDLTALPIPLIALLALGLLFRRMCAGRWMVAAAAFLLVAFSFPITGILLSLPLQSGAPSQLTDGAAPPEFIVVLTGGVYNDGAGDWRPSQSTVRRIRAAQRLQQRYGGVLLITGGKIGPTAPAESANAVQILNLGADTLLEKTARNTSESAVAVAAKLKGKNISRIALVSDATHIRRAAAVFRQQGFDVVLSASPRWAGAPGQKRPLRRFTFQAHEGSPCQRKRGANISLSPGIYWTNELDSVI